MNFKNGSLSKGCHFVSYFAIPSQQDVRDCIEVLACNNRAFLKIGSRGCVMNCRTPLPQKSGAIRSQVLPPTCPFSAYPTGALSAMTEKLGRSSSTSVKVPSTRGASGSER